MPAEERKAQKKPFIERAIASAKREWDIEKATANVAMTKTKEWLENEIKYRKLMAKKNPRKNISIRKSQLWPSASFVGEDSKRRRIWIFMDTEIILEERDNKWDATYDYDFEGFGSGFLQTQVISTGWLDTEHLALKEAVEQIKLLETIREEIDPTLQYIVWQLWYDLLHLDREDYESKEKLRRAIVEVLKEAEKEGYEDDKYQYWKSLSREVQDEMLEDAIASAIRRGWVEENPKKNGVTVMGIPQFISNPTPEEEENPRRSRVKDALSNEARRYEQFDDFETAYWRQCGRGIYWIATHDPEFRIGPRETAQALEGKFVVACSPYEALKGANATKPYVAELDLSALTPGEDFVAIGGEKPDDYTSNIKILRADLVRTHRVIPADKALRVHKYQRSLLPVSKEELLDAWLTAKSPDEPRRGERRRRRRRGRAPQATREYAFPLEAEMQKAKEAANPSNIKTIRYDHNEP